jgi:hypothetical protein
MKPDEVVRTWIASIIGSRADVMALAMSQRAKFESWLKFELAARAVKEGARELILEAPSESGTRADLGFTYESEQYHLELKTVNANWRMDGVQTKTRPITKNIQSVIDDARKLEHCPGKGLVAFVLFPIPVADDRWLVYLDRIGAATGIQLSESRHCTRVTLTLADGNGGQAVVCCFELKREE